ncbi:MAG: flagellar basal-body MS-ring/collar protein FliF [Terricaulis sp.]
MNGITDFIFKAGPTRLFAALGISAVIAALFFTLVLHVGTEDKSLLFAGVDMREAGQMTQRLEAANIPYELRGDGSSIYVARSRVLEARMMLSQDGLPSRGSIGYEIFDQPDALGQTQFQQNINRLRALEGELARTIASLDGVDSARVHLVLPERELFSQTPEQPSASIVLHLRRDALTPGQVRAIRNLVASATPGLNSNRVTILDETGRLLAAATNGDGNDNVGADGTDTRETAIEERLRSTVTDIVEGVVGAGNARVQVSADMDFERTTSTEDHFDPDGKVVRSTSSTESTAQSGQRPQGATAGANVPDATGATSGAGSQNNNNSTQETINYEISHTTTTRVNDGGTIKRLSVAVAVNGTTAPAANGRPGAYRPRSPEEMQRLTTLVQSAVGFNQTRGDSVQVVNVQFAAPDAAGTEAKAPGLLDMGSFDVTRVIEVVAALIAAMAFLFFVLRPLIGGLIRGGANAAAASGTPALAGPGGGAVAALPAPDGVLMAEPESSIDVAQVNGRVKGSSVKKMAEVVNQHPDELVQIIRGWLNNI